MKICFSLSGFQCCFVSFSHSKNISWYDVFWCEQVCVEWIKAQYSRIAVCLSTSSREGQEIENARTTGVERGCKDGAWSRSLCHRYFYLSDDWLVSLTYNFNTVKCMILKCKFSEFKGIYGTTKTFPRFTLPSPVKVCSCHFFINPHPHPPPCQATTLLISFST